MRVNAPLSSSGVSDLLSEQARYYRERAPEYDDWWFRRGAHDGGREANARWFEEAAELERELDRFRPAGDVLELACGTGLWTRHLVRHADRVTAVDASAEVIAINRERVPGDAHVEYVQADLFAWRPERLYDVCFFGFWLSHVPDRLFDGFWETVRAALRPGGRVFFLDSARRDRPDTETTVRRLADGREFRIVKRYHEPEALERRLAGLGWEIEVSGTAEHFVYGRSR
jgi:demethylmenaquinone methyltransferase/2-methoxy-6-polyprenyl-1,4-benzoquinol methylase